jgi:hypothetical protein
MSSGDMLGQRMFTPTQQELARRNAAEEQRTAEAAVDPSAAH